MKTQKDLLKISLLALGYLSISPSFAEMGAFYIGAFGGWASGYKTILSQSTIVYRKEGQLFQGQTSPTEEDYNLFVNALGNMHNRSSGLGGVHIGYRGLDNFISNTFPFFSPAIELEGFYLSSRFNGMLFNPHLEPAILPDGHLALSHSIQPGNHLFLNSLDFNSGVLLANLVLSTQNFFLERIKPYVGGGIGISFNAIANANSAQIEPTPELTSPYINHFNSNPNASATTFAAQGKAGISAKIMGHVSLFAEYRYLYIAPAHYTFGSTQYPGLHPETSLWHSYLQAPQFNSGVIGLEYSA